MKLKPWQIVSVFALLGFVIAAALDAHDASHDYTKPTVPRETALGLLSFVLCPPALLFAACIYCEAVGWGGSVMYSMIGVLNAAFYAVVGLGAAAWRKSSY